MESHRNVDIQASIKASCSNGFDGHKARACKVQRLDARNIQGNSLISGQSNIIGTTVWIACGRYEIDGFNISHIDSCNHAIDTINGQVQARIVSISCAINGEDQGGRFTCELYIGRVIYDQFKPVASSVKSDVVTQAPLDGINNTGVNCSQRQEFKVSDRISKVYIGQVQF